MTDEVTISGAPAVEVTIETAPTVAVELSAGAQIEVTLETGPTVDVTLQTAPTVEVTLQTGPTVEVELSAPPTLLFVPDGKLEGYVTQPELAAGLAGKSDAGHNHDERYYKKAEINSLLAGKSDVGHDHDGRYYQKSETYTQDEVDALLTSFRSSVLLAAHPVGSTFESEDPTSPAELFGGEWVRIKDVFTLAAGDVYAAGSTGGEAAVTLTENEIPTHTHGSRSLTGTIANMAKQSANQDITTSGICSKRTNSEGLGYAVNTQSNQPDGVIINATHTHDSFGGGAAHNNMPPYLAMYKWKRVA